MVSISKTEEKIHTHTQNFQHVSVSAVVTKFQHTPREEIPSSVIFENHRKLRKLHLENYPWNLFQEHSNTDTKTHIKRLKTLIKTSQYFEIRESRRTIQEGTGQGASQGPTRNTKFTQTPYVLTFFAAFHYTTFTNLQYFCFILRANFSNLKR